MSPASRQSTAWTAAEDSLLMQERVRGLGWQAIQQKFANKTANACRKRHERLIQKSTDDWSEEKFAQMASEYMAIRKEMWTLLAARLGTNWQTVEAKCFEKGLKNIQAAARSTARRGHQTAALPFEPSLATSSQHSQHSHHSHHNHQNHQNHLSLQGIPDDGYTLQDFDSGIDLDAAAAAGLT